MRKSARLVYARLGDRVSIKSSLIRAATAQSRLYLGRPVAYMETARVKASIFHQHLSSHQRAANHHHLSPASAGECFVVLPRWTINELPKGASIDHGWLPLR